MFYLRCVPIQVDRVLHDLNNQTLKPDFVMLVDNSTQYVRKRDYDYDLIIKRPGKNLGTNPVWNMALRLDADYVGIIGDDYRLEPQMIEKLILGLSLKDVKNRDVGAAVPQGLSSKEKECPSVAKRQTLTRLGVRVCLPVKVNALRY